MTDLEPENVSLESSPWGFTAIFAALLAILAVIWICAAKDLELKRQTETNMEERP